MFRRKRKLGRADSLRALPVCNPVVEMEDAAEGSVMLKVPRRGGFWGKLLGAAFLVPKVRKVALDDIGSEVWRMCDGKNSIGDIARSIGAKHKLHRKEAELAVLSFIDSLAKKSLVGILIPDGR